MRPPGLSGMTQVIAVSEDQWPWTWTTAAGPEANRRDPVPGWMESPAPRAAQGVTQGGQQLRRRSQSAGCFERPPGVAELSLQDRITGGHLGGLGGRASTTSLARQDYLGKVQPSSWQLADAQRRSRGSGVDQMSGLWGSQEDSANTAAALPNQSALLPPPAAPFPPSHLPVRPVLTMHLMFNLPRSPPR